MRPRLITWAQMGGNGHGKGWMSLSLTGWCKEPKSLVGDQSWCGCMTWDGVGMACKIDGRMDGELYCQILDDELQGTLSYYHKTPANVLFQQDNDPKHTSKKAKTWFNDHGFTVME